MKKLLYIIGVISLTACTPSTPQVSIEDYAILGNPAAPVTLVEYSDYQCPFCRRFTLNVLPQIQEQYIDTGVVRLVYKDFPLHIHDAAIEAAVATHCAGVQGQYYPYHDLLFERAEDITLENLVVWADELELDIDQFTTCQQDPAMEQRVLQSIQEAKQFGVVGTPSFLINGKYVTGAQPFSFFEREFLAEMNKNIDQPFDRVEDAVCDMDGDCGEPRTFPAYCSRTVSNEVCTTTAAPTCTYASTSESACVMHIIEHCTPCASGEVCDEGACVVK